MEYKNIMVSWMKEGTLSIPQLLVKHYHKLGLNETEFVLLIQVYSFLQKGNTFPTPEELSSNMSISSEQCSSILRKLIQQQFLSIEEGNAPNGILYEQYSFQTLWGKLADYVVQESKMQQVQRSMEEEKDIYSSFEQEFGRPLSPLECESLAMWIDQDGHDPVIVKAALREAVMSGKLNFRYIDRILFEWKKNGVKTIEDARNQGQRFRSHQKSNVSNEQTNAQRKTVPFYNWLEQ